MKSFVIAIAFLTCFGTALGLAFAQNPATGSTQVTQAKGEPIQDAKLQALQAEVQVMRDFTQHILSTVYFALGTVVVVLIAMVGFGWYQNIRVFERDKEALRQHLLTTLQQETAETFERLDRKATERFQSFDESIAKALGATQQRLADVQLMLAASVFHAAHAPKTPRTDFMVFSDQVDRSVGHVSPSVFEHALSAVLDHVQTSERIDSPTRTSLLKLATRLGDQHAVFGERLREMLARKPE